VKRCSKCGEPKPVSEFNEHRRRGRVELQAYCIPCARAVNSAWYAALKLKILAHYGLFCACCGESEPVFLTLDHVDGGGREHCRQIKVGGTSFYRWLISHGFPAGFRTLCFNCNSGRQVNGGICPHEEVMLNVAYPAVA